MARKRRIRTQRSKLYAQTRDIIQKVNKRLRSLESGGNYNSWASKKLFDKINPNVLNRARNKHILSLKLNKKLTDSELISIHKSARNFLKSVTSTNKGILKVETETKESMYKTLHADNEKITKEDIEDYYDMLGDSDITSWVDNHGASEVWAVIEDAKESNDNYEQFIQRVYDYLERGNDIDFKNKVQRIYEKYIIND